MQLSSNYQTDSIGQLLSCEKCDPNVHNREDDTPLHIAVRENKGAALSQLLAHQQCDPNSRNKKGDSPLHIACYKTFSRIIRLLLERRCSTTVPNQKGETAQEIPLDGDGDCLLHLACQWGDVGIIRYLITDQRCNPNIRNSSMNTPLHIAVKYYKTGETIVQLLSCEECNPNLCTSEGDTPLHTAVRENKTAALSHLLAHELCNPNVVNKEGDPPLHNAIKNELNEAVVQLLLCRKCNPNVYNREGDTPLHIAVRENNTAALYHLLAHENCDPNAWNKKGDTPLVNAVKHELNEAIDQLLSCRNCDPNVHNKEGDTPLHIAVMNNRTAAISKLLAHKQCKPNTKNNEGDTPLHIAAVACMGGETQAEMVKIAKQLLITVDPSPVNNAGQTPIELTTNYQLIQAISHFTICKTKHSVQTYINIYIVGNTETGKSTLVEAIRYEARIWWKLVPKFLRIIRNVPSHTAGIIPTTFRSKTFGNTVLHDLAGQTEYYTSNAVSKSRGEGAEHRNADAIQTTATPPAFIIVVNMSESEEKISETLRYWWSFINDSADKSSPPPQVILVGSHADKVEARGESAQEKMSKISASLKQFLRSFNLAVEVALDCRDIASRELQHLCSLVNKSCSELRQTADVNLRCHVLYAFLLEKFAGKVACTVSDIATTIKEADALLPQNPDDLIPLITTLSDKSLFLLVRGNNSNEDSWVILQKQVLLGKIDGTIFAPKDFSQHKKDLSLGTGVVPLSKLQSEFPDYNSNMITKFLIHLQICFKIDRETLELLKDETVYEENMPQNPSEEYYFFPALVSVENPLQVWEQVDVMIYQCAWLYRCVQRDQFLTTQFLHVLILRLAFSFALQLHPGDLHEDSLVLHRRCSVWKHGIRWLNRVPIETVVEVGLLNQSVIVMMRCPKGEEAKCAQLRSEVIQKVLEAKDELCKAVKMSESFIHPSDIKYPFIDNTEDLKSYSLTEIASAAINREANVLDYSGRNPFPVKDLLLFDPQTTASRELLRELFSEKHSLDEQVRGQVLEKLLEGEADLKLPMSNLYPP